MGHARGQSAERGQPIGQHQVALKLLALGHIPAEEKDGAFIVKLGEQVEHVEGCAASIAAQKVDLGRWRRPSAGQHLAQAFGHALPILAFDQVEEFVCGQLFGGFAMKRGHGRVVGVDNAAAGARQYWLGRDLDQADQPLLGLGRHRSKARLGRLGLAMARPRCACEGVADGEPKHGEREHPRRHRRSPPDTKQDGNRNETADSKERRKIARVGDLHGLHIRLPEVSIGAAFA